MTSSQEFENNRKFKILIVHAKYYEDISIRLSTSAVEVLKSKNIKKWDVIEVPGVF